MSIKLNEKQIPKGPLVLAVSGGVDSVVMLDLLVKTVPAEKLIVAHVNHGMRPEADWDQRFVAGLAERYSLEFETIKYHLKGRSEDIARQKRYRFLRDIKAQTGAQAIVTAHHRDDILETMVINTWRGTRGRGLIALRSRGDIYRPLLPFDKQQIYDYAAINRLEWVEDASNRSRRYLRNRVRWDILPVLKSRHPQAEQTLISHYHQLVKNYEAIDSLLFQLTAYLTEAAPILKINRQKFITLPSAIRREWLVFLLDGKSIERSRINASSVLRMEEFICTATLHKMYSPQNTIQLKSNKSTVQMVFGPRPRRSS